MVFLNGFSSLINETKFDNIDSILLNDDFNNKLNEFYWVEGELKKLFPSLQVENFFLNQKDILEKVNTKYSFTNFYQYFKIIKSKVVSYDYIG